jgi:hypothetical protein
MGLARSWCIPLSDAPLPLSPRRRHWARFAGAGTDVLAQWGRPIGPPSLQASSSNAGFSGLAVARPRGLARRADLPAEVRHDVRELARGVPGPARRQTTPSRSSWSSREGRGAVTARLRDISVLGLGLTIPVEHMKKIRAPGHAGHQVRAPRLRRDGVGRGKVRPVRADLGAPRAHVGLRLKDVGRLPGPTTRAIRTFVVAGQRQMCRMGIREVALRPPPKNPYGRRRILWFQGGRGGATPVGAPDRSPPCACAP